MLAQPSVLVPAARPRYRSGAVSLIRDTVSSLYYLGALILIVGGLALWVSGHGDDGRGLLAVGVALAGIPGTVHWLRQRLSRG